MAANDKRNDLRFCDATKLQIYWIFWYSGMDWSYKDIAKRFNYSYSAVRAVVLDRERYELILAQSEYDFYNNNPKIENNE